MLWPFKKKTQPCSELLDAKKAKIQAQIELDSARQKFRELSQTTQELELVNRENHISEALSRAFRRDAPQ